MPAPVIPRVKRILERGNLAGYRIIADQQLLAVERGLFEAGAVLGVYVNDVRNNVYVTHNGLILLNEDAQEYIPYKSIKIIEWSSPSGRIPEAKSLADRIVVTLFDQSQRVIPIKHGNGRFRDVFEFARFLNRVSTDIRSSTD